MAAQPKKILYTGGGTGGHITPILAVAHEVKKQNKKTVNIYVGERSSKYKQLTDGHPSLDETHQIFAGKYRRYHGESLLKRILDIKTNLLNIRDAFLFIIGLVQSVRLIDKINPDVVFLKGGYVGVPIGLAAAFRKKTIITHDSDAIPGLANRVVSRWVSLHATALPAEEYDYPSDITRQVGVLVQHDYIKVGSFLKKKYKQKLKLHANAPVVVVTGGSSGAEAINKAVEKMSGKLLATFPKLVIIHQAGKGKTKYIRHNGDLRYKLLEFLDPMFTYLGAADVVVTRASANTLAELGVQEKAAVVIPSPYLADGHQLKNAKYLEEHNAAIVLDEDNRLSKNLYNALVELLESPMKRNELSRQLGRLTPTGAAKKLANLILTINESKK